jgi:predicted aldo/keto reductase-like oxidoreductase
MAGLSSVPKERQAWLQSPETQARRQAVIAAALKWVLGNEQVDSAPVIMSTFEHLEGNVKAASEALTEDERQLLTTHLDRVSPYYCRMCQRCEGSCRAGLPVPDFMRCLMYAEGYGNMRKARLEFGQVPAPLRSVRCQSCAGCTVRCPNGVRVREQLTRAQTLLA